MIEYSNGGDKLCHTIDGVMSMRANNFYDLWIQASISAGPLRVLFACQYH